MRGWSAARSWSAWRACRRRPISAASSGIASRLWARGPWPWRSASRARPRIRSRRSGRRTDRARARSPWPTSSAARSPERPTTCSTRARARDRRVLDQGVPDTVGRAHDARAAPRERPRDARAVPRRGADPRPSGPPHARAGRARARGGGRRPRRAPVHDGGCLFHRPRARLLRGDGGLPEVQGDQLRALRGAGRRRTQARDAGPGDARRGGRGAGHAAGPRSEDREQYRAGARPRRGRDRPGDGGHRPGARAARRHAAARAGGAPAARADARRDPAAAVCVSRRAAARQRRGPAAQSGKERDGRMRILVTGGGGFVGSHVAEAYRNAGHHVAVVDVLSGGRRNNTPPGVMFYRMDIRRPELAEVFREERPEIVSHHAAEANVRASIANPVADADTNVLGTLRVLELAVRYHVSQLVFSSTAGALYGEPQRLPVGEDHPILPTAPYGFHKYLGEQYLEYYRRMHGLNTTILRYGNVYGPRQDPQTEAGVIAIFAAAMLAGRRPTIFGDGTQVRDFVYVGDVADANLRVVGRRIDEPVHIA